ncbi:hypothetical protein PRBEI_2001388700 [Prionailurus iriomotensis]
MGNIKEVLRDSGTFGDFLVELGSRHFHEETLNNISATY